MGDLRPFLNEFSDEPCWREYASHELAEVTSGNRIEEVPGQDRQVGTSASSSSSSPALMFSSLLSVNMVRPAPPRNWEQPVRMRWVHMLLANPTAVCYLNAGFTVLGWGILAHTDRLADWEQVGTMMLELLSLPDPPQTVHYSSL